MSRQGHRHSPETRAKIAAAQQHRRKRGEDAMAKTDLAIAKMLTEPDKWIDYIGRNIKPMGACLEYARRRDDFGYGVIHARGGQPRAHRVVWALVWRRVPAGLVIRHTCDNPPCVNPAHLVSGSQADNARDMYERHPRYLSAEQLAEVERLTEQGLMPKAIADELGVSPNAVRVWRRRKGYARTTPRKRTPALVQQAQELRAAGATYTAIGRALGVDKNTARRWFKPNE